MPGQVEQENTRRVQEAYAAFGRGDIPAVLGMLTEDVEWVTPGPPEVLPGAGQRRGRPEVAGFFSALHDAQEFEHFEPQEFIAQADKVVALVQSRARIRASGRLLESEFAHVFTLRGGKIARFRAFADTAAAVAAYQGTGVAR